MFVYYSKYDTGHRKDYMDFIESNYSASKVDLKGALLSSKPLLLLMYEEGPVVFFIVGLIRKIMGRRTSALLFRVGFLDVVKNFRFKDFLKKTVLLVNKNVGAVNMISIVPIDVKPALRKYVAASIYDIQFWDLDESMMISKRDGSLIRNRVVLAFLGKQDLSKGMQYSYDFLKSYQHMIDVDIGVIVRGNVSSSICQYLDRISLGYEVDVVNAFVTNDSLLKGYADSDLVWCCYDPSYDQSSGILGRAFQFGKTPVVRVGSVAADICESLNISYITFELSTGAIFSIERPGVDVLSFKKRNTEALKSQILGYL